MSWIVEFHEDFEKEFKGFHQEVQDELLAKALLLEEVGPQLGRPHVDTLKGSKYVNMKELRFDADDGVWRVAFAFDPDRKSILLAGGDKKGKDQKQFYKKLIKTADNRLDQHLKTITIKEKDHGNSNSKSAERTTKKTAGKNKGKSR
jgi:hypothetical protein